MENVTTGLRLNIPYLLWRRKLSISVAMLFSMITVVCVGINLPNRYTAEGLLLLEARESLAPELNVLQQAPQAAINQRSRTEIEMLRSRALLEGVARDLDSKAQSDFLPHTPSYILGKVRVLIDQGKFILSKFSNSAFLNSDSQEVELDPADLVVERLRQQLRVYQSEGSQLISVRIETQSPSLAATIVNSVMKRYIESEVSARRLMTLQANYWLSSQAEVLRAEVEAADVIVQQFRAQHNLLQLQAGSLSAVQANNEQAQLSTLRQERARLQSALETLRYPTNQSKDIAANEFFSSVIIQQLRDRETEVTQRASTLRQRYGERHPDLAAVESELQNLRRQMTTETNKIISAVQRDLTIITQRVVDLEQRVASANSTAQESASNEVTLMRLTREAEAKRRVYEAFAMRTAQTQFSGAQFPPARIASVAVPPLNPDGPSIIILGCFGAIAGGLTAMAAVIMLGLYRGGLASVYELKKFTQLPSFGSLPELRRASKLIEGGAADVIETLRAMRVRIQSMPSVGLGGVVLVTSAVTGEGKTTLAASLAQICAADGLRVLLVEADLRRRRLAVDLGLDKAPGIESVLVGDLRLNDAIQIDAHSGLHCILATENSSNPHGLLRSSHFANLIQQAKNQYDLIVIDSPPVLRVSDALLLLKYTGLVLMAVRWERTSRSLVAEAVRRLTADHNIQISTVLTRVQSSHIQPQDHYLGYGSVPIRTRALSAPALSRPPTV